MEIPQGTSPNNRIGQSVLLTSLHIKGTLRFGAHNHPLGATNDAGSNHCMVLVVLDTQVNGVKAGWNDVFDIQHDQVGVDIGNGEGYPEHGFRNLVSQKRFKILAVRKYLAQQPMAMLTDAQANGSAASTLCYYGVSHKKIGINVKVMATIDFNGSTGNITELCCNNIQIMYWTQSTGIVTMDLNTRVRFLG